MKMYKLKNKKDGKIIGIYNNANEAGLEVVTTIMVTNALENDEDKWLTPFDFELVECDGEISSFDDARKYLGLSPVELDGIEQCKNDGIIRFIRNLNPHIIGALSAFNKLMTIAEAWNKEDGFVPDFSNVKQDKYYPWFNFDSKSDGFVFARTYNAASVTDAYFVSIFCFKTKDRAERFGKSFINLWNKLLTKNEHYGKDIR